MPELLLTPPAQKFMAFPLVLMVNGLAPALNTTPPTSVNSESVILVVMEVLKIATAVIEFGTVCGVQLVGVFHSGLPGFKSHVSASKPGALPHSRSAAFEPSSGAALPP